MASGTSTAAPLLPVAHAHPAGFPPMPTNSGLNTPMLQHSGMPDPKNMTTGSQGVGQTMGGGFNGLVPDQRAGTHPYGIDSLLHMQYWHHQQQQKQQHHQHPQHQPQQQHQQQQQQQQHAQQQQQQQHAPQQAHHVVGQLHQYPQQSQQQHQQQHQPQQQQQQPQQSQHHHQQQQHLRAMGAMMMGGMSGTSPPGPMPHAIGMGGVNSATVTSPHSGEQANPYARFGLASHFDPRRYR
ncbi:unnamed protein product [Ostreobium quekettii]|uniref:Uncharacterized protein n=1 Tax=Ostreobium quekettii TaxID=121088 RepID=A0A8S1JAG3_9CHLO|nr:unnamed protein product [Ostreobium quekettii]